MKSIKTKLLDLGRKGYREVWELQEQLLEEVKEKKFRGGMFYKLFAFGRAWTGIYFGKKRQ